MQAAEEVAELRREERPIERRAFGGFAPAFAFFSHAGVPSPSFGTYDAGLSVTNTYADPFPFTGKIERVGIQVGPRT